MKMQFSRNTDCEELGDDLNELINVSIRTLK